MGSEWVGEARKIVAQMDVWQLRNLYGTGERERAAEIEAARMSEASRRKSARERFERAVDAGVRPDDAEAVIEFEDASLRPPVGN